MIVVNAASVRFKAGWYDPAEVIYMTLAGSRTPTQSLALALLRMLADAGVSRDPDTWALLGEAGFKQVFGEASYRAFVGHRAQVWPAMVELAGLVETWP